MSTLELVVELEPGESRPLQLAAPRLVVAGYTGRDTVAVERHIVELEMQGIRRPPRIPMFYFLPGSLLVNCAGTVEVLGDATCGEAEPVLIREPDGELYVGVGSDHTDRKLEQESVLLSKAICPKVLGPSVWPFNEVADRWDQLRLQSFVGEGVPYQDERLAAIREPLELLGRAEAVCPADRRSLVVFLGTIPLRTGGFQFDSNFTVVLEDRERGRALRCAYHTELVPELLAGE